MKAFLIVVLMIVIINYISRRNEIKASHKSDYGHIDSSDENSAPLAQTDKTEKFATFGRDAQEWRCNDCEYIYQGINKNCPQCGADRALRAMPVDFSERMQRISNQNTKKDNKEIVRTAIVSEGSSKFKTKTKTSSMIGRGLVGGAINPVAGLAGAVTAKKTTKEIKSKYITFAVEYKDGKRKLVKTKVGSKEYKRLAKYL